MEDDEKRTIKEIVENVSLLLRDRAIYGMTFVDVTGKRIDPAPLESWCSMNLPKTVA